MDIDTEAWIIKTKHQFAKRCRQEAEMQEGKFIPVLFQGLPPVIQYEWADEIIHTDTHPFCDDPACLCHDDVELIMEYLERPFDAGLLTSPEYFRIKEGKQL